MLKHPVLTNLKPSFYDYKKKRNKVSNDHAFETDVYFKINKIVFKTCGIFFSSNFSVALKFSYLIKYKTVLVASTEKINSFSSHSADDNEMTFHANILFLINLIK